eukprot:m.97401 g.97401  ORF g.97401 m.97401 type:complete len:102 (+) comp15528_c0_seq2:122-427(+)
MASVAARLRPLFDRVLVQRIVAETKTKSGILLPEAAQATSNEGVIVACGQGQRTAEGKVVPLLVKEGDRVLLPDFGGQKVVLGEKEFFLYREGDLLGVLGH